jgi:hypothetical protein
LSHVVLYLRGLIKQKIFSLNKVLVATKTEEDVKRLITKLWPQNIGVGLLRIGSSNDGGYLVPDDLEGIGGLFSPGVAEDSSFENYFAQLGTKCFLADGSVLNPPIQHENFRFIKKYIGLISDEQSITLDEWVRDNTKSSELILQMDIEGSEYEVLLSTSSATLKKFRFLIIEFHEMDRIITKDGFLVLNTLITRLLHDFVVVHAHPNNNCGTLIFKGITIPRSIELTFARRDRIKNLTYVEEFPNGLDARNLDFLPDIELPRDWYYQD